MDGNLPETTRFAADPAGIGLAVAAAHAFAEARRLPNDMAVKLAIIVEELVANIVEHGGAPGTEVELTLATRRADVTITLLDHGPAFDPRRVEPASSPPERGGGAGLRLVLAWVTVESLTRTNDINRLLLSLSGHDISCML